MSDFLADCILVLSVGAVIGGPVAVLSLIVEPLRRRLNAARNHNLVHPWEWPHGY